MLLSLKKKKVSVVQKDQASKGSFQHCYMGSYSRRGEQPQTSGRVVAPHPQHQGLNS